MPTLFRTNCPTAAQSVNQGRQEGRQEGSHHQQRLCDDFRTKCFTATQSVNQGRQEGKQEGRQGSPPAETLSKTKKKRKEKKGNQSIQERRRRRRRMVRKDLSEIKNKIKRQEVYLKRKKEKEKEKFERKLQRRKEAEELGDAAPPKQVPKTLDSLREADNTTVEANDHEVIADEEDDEFAPFFSGEKKPKIMITTRPRPSGKLFNFIADLMLLVPNSFFYRRKSYTLDEIQGWAAKKEFTHLIVLGEKNKVVNQLLLTHLPKGPTALFKVSSVKHHDDIRGHANSSFHLPEIILNRFTTRVGHRVGRFLGSLYEHNPEFRGRNVVTFHNQRDFIFVRHHRYMFADTGKKAKLHEIGPRFTLKLKWLMAGKFDTQHGEYEWIHKRKEMETSRRRFAL